MEREGHTEAAVDLARLSGLYPAGVICEIINDDGRMARVPDLMEFAKKYDLKIITIKDLVCYRKINDSIIKRVSEAKMPTKYGDFKIIGYVNVLNNEHHIALVKGNICDEDEVLVRIHSECLTGDVFGSLRCDCGEQLKIAMENINKQGKGVILYMRQEGRGIGLINKIKAYNLQDEGYDTVEANNMLGFPDDIREYSISAQILKDIGVRKVKLMTNNPRKINELKQYGIEVSERVPIQVQHNNINLRYLKSKKQKLGHLLSFKEEF